MTKTIIIGEGKDFEDKKKIKIFKCLEAFQGNNELTLNKASCTAGSWNFLELICRNYMGVADLIFAYDFEDQRHYGVLYIGSWNDGVV